MATPSADITSFTDEQKKLFYDAAQLGSGIQVKDTQGTAFVSDTVAPPVPTPPPTSTINSSTLNAPPTTNFQQPNTTPTYPTSTLPEPDFSLSTPEQGAEDLITQLKTLNTERVGESAYRTEQENIAGVPQIQATIRDLGAQLTALKNEAAAIPLQLQQESTGRGITTGGLAPIEAGRLRTNAIAALGVSTLLAASQGQLANAQSLADKAVAQKYDPIQERIDAGMKNLELIMNSPSYTLAEKKRAFAQQQYLQQQSQLLAEKKANESEIWNIATTAASNIQSFTPSSQYQTPAQALQAIQNAPTKEQALQIAVASGFLSSTTKGATSSIQEYEYAKSQGYTGSFIDYQNQGSGGSGLLSVTEAQKLGVPFGTTVEQAASMGITPSSSTGTVKLAASAQEKISTLTTLEQLGNQVITLGQQTNWSGVGGLGSGSIQQFLAKNFGYGTPEAEELRNTISNITATLAKARGGTSFTANEQKLLEQYTPTINDSPLTIQAKISSLNNYIQSERQNVLNTAAGTQQDVVSTVDEYLLSLGF